jgi:hypothetical protein
MNRSGQLCSFRLLWAILKATDFFPLPPINSCVKRSPATFTGYMGSHSSSSSSDRESRGEDGRSFASSLSLRERPRYRLDEIYRTPTVSAPLTTEAGELEDDELALLNSHISVPVDDELDSRYSHPSALADDYEPHPPYPPAHFTVRPIPSLWPSWHSPCNHVSRSPSANWF